jgi:hypothetical protein
LILSYYLGINNILYSANAMASYALLGQADEGKIPDKKIE